MLTRDDIIIMVFYREGVIYKFMVGHVFKIGKEICSVRFKSTRLMVNRSFDSDGTVTIFDQTFGLLPGAPKSIKRKLFTLKRRHA